MGLSQSGDYYKLHMMKERSPIILVFCEAYLPGYKAGGPVRTITNLVEHLGDEFHFKIITMNHDWKDADNPYQSIRPSEWHKVGKADVFYIDAKKRSCSEFKSILNTIEYDIVYLNSFFSPNFTIRPLLFRRLQLIHDTPFILAPRGEFSDGALNLKLIKKKIYINLARLLGLYQRILWQASSVYEEADIRSRFDKNIELFIAPNLPLALSSISSTTPKKVYKSQSTLKIVFLSRIAKMKNLKGALEVLKGLKGDIKFDIYGPIEDMIYWDECQATFRNFPQNIKIRHLGSVPHDNVMSIISEYDIFFLPTLGENYGHVILEALCAGCPVLISDQTPWRDLEKKKVGWDLPLEQPEQFHAVLQKCVDMSHEDYYEWSQNARKYGYHITKDNYAISQNRELFQKAITSMNLKGPFNRETSHV